MTKKIILIATLFLGVIGFSQENTSSPYSFYGLGEVKFKGTEDARATGGLSFSTDSISINLLNPASYAGLKLTSFGVGGTTTFTKMSTATSSEKAKRTSLDYLAVGIPMGKFGATVGLMPYSSVGYKIQTTGTDPNDNLSYTKRFTGEGNINRIFIGTGYAINKNFSIGVDIQYNFGTIETEAVKNITNIQLLARERNTSLIKGVSFNTGLSYKEKLNEKLTFQSSFTFSPEAKLNLENSRNIASISYNVNGTEFVNNSKNITINNTKLIIPTKISLGAGIGENNKWLIGTEITLQNSSNQNNRFDEATIGSYENSQKYVIGGYYIPKHDSYKNYLNKVIYRAGFRYENTGLVINNESIKDYGMNFGVGLPLGYSKINIGVEFGKKGTTNNGLIEEDYFNLSIGLSLSDKWFRKRKID